MNTYGYADFDTANFLAFDAEFQSKLPKKGGDDWFDAEILDRLTGRTHVAKIEWIAYEDEPFRTISPDGEWIDDAHSVQHYFYHQHWCGCHRIGDIENAGGEVPMPELEGLAEGTEEWHKASCPRGRFLVKKLTHRSMPDVNLFFETEE